MSLEDDVAEVNNDFVYNKFATKQQTADSVIFRELDDGTVELLIIKRKRGPHRSLSALPGGIVEADININQLVQGVVDPGQPVFRNTLVHDFLMPFGTTVLDMNDSKSRANEIFGAEALREAIEEVSLNKDVIKNSFYLPVKYDRYDWDARAARGVDVGGIGMLVDNDWVPTAKDDALSYEWIKLDDVINGVEELAFGHVEFVRDALRFSITNDILKKSNSTKLSKGKSKYTFNDIEELSTRVLESSQRNTRIIEYSNIKRRENNVPEIPIEGNNLVDRKNKALIDSIRGLSSYTGYGDNPVKLTASMQMSPDYIFIDIFQELTDQALINIDFAESDLSNIKDVSKYFEGTDSIDRADSGQILNTVAELNASGKSKAKSELKNTVLQKYRSKLKWKINDGMQIGSYIAAMMANAEQIVNSKEFNVVLENLLSEGIVVEKSFPNPDSDTFVYTGLEYRNNELAEYVKLSEQNTIIESKGLSEAVDDNIEYVKNNFGDEVGNALQTIRTKNKIFFEKTFPEEIYMAPFDYYKDNATSMPEAMLETQKLKLTGDNKLQGIVYHGSPGMNAKGRAVKEILEKYLIGLRLSPSIGQNFANTMEGYLNRITYENNINWLDPRKFRGNQLRLNYMYSTSNPFVATDYSIGGAGMDSVALLNSNINDAYLTILNHVDVLAKDDVETLNKINNELKKIGLVIRERDNIEKTLELVDITTDIKPYLADPGIMQIKFDAPVNSILHTDMPITRQLNNPNVQTLLKKVVDNLDGNNIFDEDTIDQFIFSLLDEIGKTNTPLNMPVGSSMQSKVFSALTEAATEPDSPYRKLIKDYYINNLGDNQKTLLEEIQKIVQEGTGTFSDFQELVANKLYVREAVSDNVYKEAFDYAQKFNLSTDYLSINTADNAGYVMFTKLLNDAFPDQDSITWSDVFKFAKDLPLDSLGGSYSATRDLYYIQKLLDVVTIDSDIYNDFVKTFQGQDIHLDLKVFKELPGQGFPPTANILQDLAKYSEEVSRVHNLRFKTKYNIDTQKELKTVLENIDTDVDNIVYKNTNNIPGDKDIINFLNRVNGVTKIPVEAVGRPMAYADTYLLKALSESSIEIVAGTGGGRRANYYHDVFGIVDPGDKFGTGVPRQTTFVAKGIEFDKDTIEELNEIISGNKSFADLSDREIKSIAGIVPFEVIANQDTLSQETKDRYAKLYADLDIRDVRFVEGNIDPRPIDGVFLQQFDELRTMLAQQSIFGDVKEEVVQNHVAKMMNTLQGQVDPQDVTKVMNATGLTRTLANGVDLFDAAVIGPVLIDLLMSRVSGVGSETATIGGAVADVAQDIYDPTETDTVFETLYGSPEDPGTLAGAVSDTLEIGKERYVNPLLDGAKNNKVLMSMFDGLKEGAVSALNTVKDGFGLNDWIYNVKRDMYVSSKLKEKGYTGDTVIPKGLVKDIENEYESALPRTTDKYGQPLDVGDTTNFPSYNPGRR